MYERKRTETLEKMLKYFKEKYTDTIEEARASEYEIGLIQAELSRRAQKETQ